jgi:dipeptidase E
MKFYISSYRLGNKTDEYKKMVPNGKVGYISNALDFPNPDFPRLEKHKKGDISSLEKLGLKVGEIDLKKYFGKKEELEKKLKELGAIYISGGNVYILIQAMKLSGFDVIIKSVVQDKNFLYSGYSAGGCVLSESLKGYDMVDEPGLFPYPEQKETVWQGLGLIGYHFLPHFKSDHPESKLVDKELEYCIENKIPYKTLKDGEVIIF